MIPIAQGKKPPVIQGRIEVVELSMGKEVRLLFLFFSIAPPLPSTNPRTFPIPSHQPPTLTLLEIGDLSLDRFRGIFRLGYSGDAWLEVRCLVQANPLSHNQHLTSSTLPLSTPLLANKPLLVPMTLRLSSLHLRAILILVVSASKGITLVFKNDPLQNVSVSSTFDSIEVIRGYLQQEIEGQLREMFREDLPGIIHRLSQKWFSDTGMGGKVEMPYRGESFDVNGNRSGHDQDLDEDPFDMDPEKEREIFPPYHPPSSTNQNGTTQQDDVNSPSRRKSISRLTTLRKSSSAASESPTSYTTFPDIEEYDPTYGMRPEGLPTHSGYEAFGRLWEKAREGKQKGLGSLMTLAENPPFGRREEDEDEEGEGEEEDEEENGDVTDTDIEEDGQRSFDMVDMVTALPPSTTTRGSVVHHRSSASSLGGFSTHSRMLPVDSVLEWETIPAVGGGMVSRPRIFHVQSQIRAPSEAGGAGGMMPSPSGTAGTATGGSVTARASSVRSSIGGSTLGLGAAKSWIGGQTKRDFARNHALTRLVGGGPSNSNRGMSTGRSDVVAPMSSRPGFQRQHNRAESVPGQSAMLRRSSQLKHTIAAAVPGHRTSTSSMDTLGGTYSTGATSQLPPSRPQSMAAYPGAKHITPPRPRRLSVTFQPFQSGSPPYPGSSYPPKINGIVLPLNDSVSQLATLSHSNHTLSPYARNHEHVAVRSFPHLSRVNAMVGPGSPQIGSPQVAPFSGPDSRLVRAKRKRIFKLGGSKGGVTDGVGDEDVFLDDNGTPTQHDVSRRSSSSSEGYGHHSIGQAATQLTGSSTLQRPSRLNAAHSRPGLSSRNSYGFPSRYQAIDEEA